MTHKIRRCTPLMTYSTVLISAILFSGSTAKAAILTTSTHPDTSIMDWEIDGNTTGPLELTGTLDASINLDSFGDGTIEFQSASLIQENILDFSTGVFDYQADLVDLVWDIESDPITVTGNSFTLDGASFVQIRVVGGTLELYDGFFPDETINFATNPHTFDTSTINGLGITGTVFNGPDEINLAIPDPGLPVSFNFSGFLVFQLNISGAWNVAAIPEPSTWLFAATSLFWLTPVFRGRRNDRAGHP